MLGEEPEHMLIVQKKKERNFLNFRRNTLLRPRGSTFRSPARCMMMPLAWEAQVHKPYGQFHFLNERASAKHLDAGLKTECWHVRRIQFSFGFALEISSSTS